MIYKSHIPLPILFNPLKHHLSFIREYISGNQKSEGQTDNLTIIRDLKHLGGSLMDIYSGSLSPVEVIEEIMKFLKTNNLTKKDLFSVWTGKNPRDFKTVKLSDDSEWILKYYNDEMRYVHPFPARFSPHSLRVKANTLKSAILYLIFKDKDFVTAEDLNSARAFSGLSSIKDVFDTEAITEMIEILRV